MIIIIKIFSVPVKNASLSCLLGESRKATCGVGEVLVITDAVIDNGDDTGSGCDDPGLQVNITSLQGRAIGLDIHEGEVVTNVDFVPIKNFILMNVFCSRIIN